MTCIWVTATHVEYPHNSREMAGRVMHINAAQIVAVWQEATGTFIAVQHRSDMGPFVEPPEHFTGQRVEQYCKEIFTVANFELRDSVHT